MENYPEYQYYIVKDEFQIYFPKEDYTIDELLYWYKITPTQPKKISYYGKHDESLMKEHFKQFAFLDVKSKISNDLHSNQFLTVWCIAIYNDMGILEGFSAQEIKNSFPAEKKISYLMTLQD